MGSPGFTSLVGVPCWGEDGEPDLARGVVVIGTDRGPWVKALAAAGYRVYAVNPQAGRPGTRRRSCGAGGKKGRLLRCLRALADMGPDPSRKKTG